MANKKAVLLQLAEYFADKGSMMSPAEYNAADDAPMRFIVAKRPFGSWARMQAMVKSNHLDLWLKTQAPAPAVPASDPVNTGEAFKAKVAPKAKVASKAKAAPKKAKK